ncbi:MAG: HmuY family protein [Flavobacteriales bacterium]|nr:HmuY family protein [Flavobacteriales bacterium]
MKFAYLLLTALIISSCMKDEIPVPKHEAGSNTTNSINLGSDYRYQAYYDLETNTFVQEHEKIAWDLGFECAPSGFRIILNSAKSMAASNANCGNFTAITDTVGSFWKYDVSSGNLDSTAIGDWLSSSSVYVIDRGYSHDGTHQGFRKLEIEQVNTNEYQIHYAELDGSGEETHTIQKDGTYNFVFFSFDANSTVSIQPPKEEWDLVFGQYSHLFEPTFPYQVTGVRSNRNGVEVAEVFDKAFESIVYADINLYDFSPNIDIIGYDWKTFVGGTYETHSDKNFIVKTTEGLYYKLHFIDFYTSTGEKGNPIFEVSAL